MFKSKILTILYILCFLSLNATLYATDSESKETNTQTVSESTVEKDTKDNVKTEADDEEEKSSPAETEESEEDEEPDC